MRRQLRVLLGEREPGLRRGIELVLGGAQHELASTDNAIELLALAHTWHPDVILVEEVLVDEQTLAALAERAPTALLATAVNEPGFWRAIRGGARGYLPRALSAERLPAVVEALARGETALPSQMITLIVAGYNRRGRSSGLTTRQAQIAVLLEQGLSRREIGDLLGLSPVTIRRHASELARRLRAAA